MKYRTPPLTNILMAHYNRIYFGVGRFCVWTEALEPEKVRGQNMIACAEPITAISRDRDHLYLHMFNSTKVLTGHSVSDFLVNGEHEFPIGAIKQRTICPHEFDVPYPVFMTRRGWARAVDGRIEYIDKPAFRLDLPSTAIAYTGYDEKNSEALCSIKT